MTPSATAPGADAALFEVHSDGTESLVDIIRTKTDDPASEAREYFHGCVSHDQYVAISALGGDWQRVGLSA